jgi:flagellar hook assembly protein FlgD/outer membrane protein OmpA-like peptidoglycan-associated protein
MFFHKGDIFRAMKKITVIMVLFFLITVPSMWAQYNPVNGGENSADLLSPTFIAGGAAVTSTESPAADALNPSASGLKQRTTLDISYIGLVGFGDTAANQGYRGHAANLGVAIPSRYGVFNLSGHFYHSPFQDINLGTQGSIDFSFAKDLYPNLLVGAGVHTAFGFNQAYDWALQANLGFLHFPGDLGFLKDFSWGLSIQGLGKPFSPLSGYSGYPAPFTPVLGASFSLIRTENVVWGFNADIGFPSFQNVDFSVGSHVTLFDFFSVRVTGHYDIVELTNPNVSMRSPLPGFGISFNFKTNIKKEAEFFSERGWNRSEIKTQIAAAPLQAGIWAFGAGANIPLGVVDSVGPEIHIDYPELQYVSPDNDGTKDTFAFPLEIKDGRYVKGYTVKIYNEEGETVREIRNKEKRPENQGFQNIIDRLTYVKSGIEVPEKIRWDGKGDDGSLVPDGTYTFQVESWDDNGNMSVTEPESLVIDATDPEIEIEVEEENKIFSPNDDGLKDTITITQSGSEEDLWEGEIYAIGGDAVRTFTWENGAPAEFIWDGTNDDGILVPDGVYGYRTTSTDRAGNETTASVDNIVINTQSTPISLTIDASYFAPGDPNNDGARDSITFVPDIPVKRGIRTWSVTVKDQYGKDYFAFTGTEEVPESLMYTGMDSEGVPLPEGEYFAELEVLYENGNNPKEKSPVFTVDVTEPFASVTGTDRIFSPNGDGNKDLIVLIQETSREEIWTGTVSNEEEQIVRTLTWIKEADTKVSWDGYTDEGTLAPDGTYTYILNATDKAGNIGSSKAFTFDLDTEGTEVLLTVDREAFSPNGDGVLDTITITPKVEKNSEIERYTLSIEDRNGRRVKTVEGRGFLQENYTWNGLDDRGKLVPDEMYSAKIDILYRNGNNPAAATRFFTVDTVFPSIEVELENKLFSPDGDGNKDALEVIHEASRENRWEGAILDTDGNEIRTFMWEDRPENFSWDGTDSAGNTVPDGNYIYTVFAEDNAGNRTESEATGIEIDTRQTAVFLTAQDDGISPNGDGFKDTIEFRTIVNLKEGISSWKLEMIHTSGDVEKVFSGEGVPEEKFIWDGINDTGEVREGTYTPRFTVVYDKGNRPEAESKNFILDLSPPDADISMNPKPFSPDNDGVDDELYINISVSDMTGIQSWKLTIQDPKNNPFYEFSGKGEPADQIVWDGKSEDGELVLAAEDYPWRFTAEDYLGNEVVENGTIPVDILVIREGDRLKIRISNITFEPNSPNLVLDESEKGVKNQQVLERLAEILNKYNNYRIRIEGHAVRVYWYDEERGEREEKEELLPLSESRAERVKDALVMRGVDPRRVSIKGLGGTEPIVPHSDLDNRWKNRRVEFILVR